MNLNSRCWRAIKKAFENPHCVFSANFGWICKCGYAGFPGCTNIECFVTRVYLCLRSYHQITEEEQFAYILSSDNQGMLAIGYSCEDIERISHFQADFLEASSVIRQTISGVRLRINEYLW